MLDPNDRPGETTAPALLADWSGRRGLSILRLRLFPRLLVVYDEDDHEHQNDSNLKTPQADK